jgi:lactate dehydrogenase-like 2-hydroxyacid dehydrogenase
MPVAKIDILMVGPQAATYADALEREFTVHKLWLAPDREAFLAEHAGRIRGIATNAPVGASKALIEALPRLEIIASSGVGLDAIDLATARARGVIVTHTPSVLNDCVADTGLMLMLAVARRLCEAERFVRAGRWLEGKFPLATSLAGKTCGILGMGNIGRAVAKRAEAFGMKIAYSNPSPRPDLAYACFASPIELARAADFLVLALPGGPATRHLVDAELLAALGPAGFLVNIARGSVVDEKALVAALQEGRIAGAALDVFEDEPQVPAELLAMENVVLTPHLASGTHETRNAMSRLAFANLQAHFSGRPVLTRAP